MVFNIYIPGTNLGKKGGEEIMHFWTIKYNYKIYSCRADTFGEACMKLGIPWNLATVVSVSK
jgi:hypothetical protein